jgi:hypothetical protein
VPLASTGELATMSGVKLTPIDEPPRERPTGEALRERHLAPIWIAFAAAAALIASSLVPSRQTGASEREGEEVIEQPPGADPVRSPDEVVERYRLDSRLEAYLDVDKEGRIIFDPGHRPNASDRSEKGRKAGDE